MESIRFSCGAAALPLVLLCCPRHSAVPSVGGECARRIGLAVMPSFELHYFESEVTPEGPLPVADWVAYFRKLHAGFARAHRKPRAQHPRPLNGTGRRRVTGS